MPVPSFVSVSSILVLDGAVCFLSLCCTSIGPTAHCVIVKPGVAIIGGPGEVKLWISLSVTTNQVMAMLFFSL
jgi:hypothetical protein